MVFVLIFMIYLFIYSKRCQQKQVEATTFLLPPATKLGQAYVFTSTIKTILKPMFPKKCVKYKK